jgi:hypothetical protein
MPAPRGLDWGFFFLRTHSGDFEDGAEIAPVSARRAFLSKNENPDSMKTKPCAVKSESL